MNKKMIFILRLGKNDLVKGDAIAVKEILGENATGYEAVAKPIRVGIITLIVTEKSVKEVSEAFKRAEVETDDTLPHVAWDANSDAAMFDIESEGVGRMIADFVHENNLEDIYGVTPITIDKEQCNLSLNELLDIISKVGLSNLTSPQLAKLKSLQ